ncbi:group I intron endonuclease [compost metagenome]
MIVYLIRNAVTGKCYVGQTRRTLQQRFYSHKKVVGKANACKALSDAMLKHGPENFTIELLCTCTSQADMDNMEIQMIAELGTFSPGGYNLTRGGGGKSGYKHSAESIEKMASTHRGKPLTDEHKKKVSASLVGNTRALGMKHSDETRRKISERGTGRKRAPFSAEHREKIAASRRGTKASDAARQKMSEGQKRRQTNVGATAARSVLEVA